jgi:Ser/Thr protein kinase RdoA (MazF antagonist)
VEHPYARLTPDLVLDAVAAAGLRPDGRLLGLNSYENRVYQVWLEDGSAVVAKFYRPERWSDAQIDEEHAFARELAEREVPVVAPLHSLHHADFRVAIYPRRGGRTPDLDNPKTLEWTGRFIARIHAVGAAKPFKHRETLNQKTFGHAQRAYLLETNFIPADLLKAWQAVTEQTLSLVDEAFKPPYKTICLHGDCHPGNILWREEGEHAGPLFVDLDDACTGPAIQDLWMLLSGGREAMQGQLSHVLHGYRAFTDFNPAELGLVEALRTLRMIHHSAWLAERWSDPAFPAAFPWFGTPAYWDQQTAQLREQLEHMALPPLQCW